MLKARLIDSMEVNRFVLLTSIYMWTMFIREEHVESTTQKYDRYYGNIDISPNINIDSNQITIVPCWDEGYESKWLLSIF